MDESEANAGKREPCQHFVLARGAVGDVEYCVACAIFHVNIDAMSIRFRATSLRELRDTLSAALAAHERALRRAEAGETLTQHDGLH